MKASQTVAADPVLRTGKIYALLGVVSFLVPLIATFMATSRQGTAAPLPNLPEQPEAGLALVGTLLFHGSMLLPVVLLLASVLFLMMGASRLREAVNRPGSAAAKGPEAANKENRVAVAGGTNKGLLIAGFLLVVVAMVLVGTMHFMFISPCTSRAAMCWQVMDFLQTGPMLMHVWLPPIVAVVGVVLTFLAMPKRAR
ncbi:MAG: hypothetical protein Q4P06_02445 [Actinomycetaceae bacterium]|nr:hypothetical protein [Actinomycetaceae bacterium]